MTLMTPEVHAKRQPTRANYDPQKLIPDGLWNLLETCWHYEPSSRPNISIVLRNLSSIMAELPRTSSPVRLGIRTWLIIRVALYLCQLMSLRILPVKSKGDLRIT